MLKYTILSFIAYFSFINTNVLEAQSAQNLINAPGTFNFNTANSVDGNQTREEYDSDADGTADYISTYTYDANGNRTRLEVDSDADGTADRIYTYTYDTNGNRTSREYDNDGDGTADDIYTFTYLNTVLCPDLAKGLVHKLLVDIPESGVWRFSLCGSDFQNVMALS
ncbi:MAG: hypothetical protein P8O20_05030, partial [Bacteroidia bacterium]|nr:hypothetical protein [Bacteroidia bacterium]